MALLPSRADDETKKDMLKGGEYFMETTTQTPTPVATPIPKTTPRRKGGGQLGNTNAVKLNNPYKAYRAELRQASALIRTHTKLLADINVALKEPPPNPLKLSTHSTERFT